MKRPEDYLVGALDLVRAGMKPSDAVSIGACTETEAGLAHYLGIGSLRDLDRMSPRNLWRTLQPYALTNL